MNTPNKTTHTRTESATSPDAASAPSERSALPRTVIRGESLSNGQSSFPDQPIDSSAVVHPHAALTDWLNCSFPLEDTHTALHLFVDSLVEICGESFGPPLDRKTGFQGWNRSYKLGKSKAILGIGGQNNRAFLSMTGESCSLVPKHSWHHLKNLLQSEYRAKITRWDGAVDDFAGIHSVDWAIEQFREGRFKTGGNSPKPTQHGNWLTPDGKGRTLEIGNRANGKMMRIYEKGKQLGDPTSKWVRWELELKSKDRNVPWNVLVNPGPYVAGAYKATDWISQEACRVRTYKETTKITYESLCNWVSKACGQQLNVMLSVEGDSSAVVGKVIREGIPRRLQITAPPEITQPSGDE